MRTDSGGVPTCFRARTTIAEGLYAFRMTRFVLPPRKRRESTPSQLPLDEQAGLCYEIQRRRRQSPPVTWKRIADEEGFAQRTLEYFHRSWTKLEQNRETRSQAEIFLERFEGAREPPPASPDPRPDRQVEQDPPQGSEEASRGIEPAEPQPVEKRQAAKENHGAEPAPGSIRQLVETLERLDDHREAAQKQEDELRDARWAQSIRARQMLGARLEQLREATLRREEEGLPPDDEEIEDGEAWDAWWGPMP
jgi:hypothetical protein